jgi:hypothetical protein
MYLIKTENVECEVSVGGKTFGGGVSSIKWNFGVTPGKQDIFTMDVQVLEQELEIKYYEYNEETDEEDEKIMTFTITDYFKQVKVISEVENFLNGFSISYLRIDTNRKKIEVTLK